MPTLSAKISRRVLLGLAATVAALGVAGGPAGAGGGYPAPSYGSPAPRSISITKATVAGRVVTLRISIGGFKTYPALVGKRPNKPDGGHWHVFVDGKYNNASASVTAGRTLKLKPGSHRIHVELANNDHSSLKPRVLSKSITVRFG